MSVLIRRNLPPLFPFDQLQPAVKGQAIQQVIQEWPSAADLRPADLIEFIENEETWSGLMFCAAGLLYFE